MKKTLLFIALLALTFNLAAGELPDIALPETENNDLISKDISFPANGQLISTFGMHPDPFTGSRRFHNGIDIAGPEGTHIMASMEGTVAITGENQVYGRYIILSHANGIQTMYAHLSRIIAQRGDAVAMGQLIAEMGNTGYSVGPHLHFAVFQNGLPVDPLLVLR